MEYGSSLYHASKATRGDSRPHPTPTFSQTLTVALKNEMKFEFSDIHPDILDYPLS